MPLFKHSFDNSFTPSPPLYNLIKTINHNLFYSPLFNFLSNLRKSYKKQSNQSKV